jgi:hypothetical protein
MGGECQIRSTRPLAVVGQGACPVQSGMTRRPHLAITGWVKFRARPHIAIRESTKLNAIVSSAETTSRTALGVKFLGQANIEHEQRHGDAENTVVQGVEPALLEA